MTLPRCLAFVAAGCLSLGAAASDTDRAKVRSVAQELERQRTFEAARRQVDLFRREAAATPAERWEARAWECNLWEREGWPSLARLCWAEVARQAPVVEDAALAAFHAARLRAANRPDMARREAMAVLLRWPRTHGAHRALQWLRGDGRARGQEADVLLGVVSQLPHTEATRELRAECWIEAARLRLTSGNPALMQSAARLLARGRQAAQETVWWDDALFWSGRAARLLGQHQQALAWYGQLLEERESSWWVGSYDSPYLDDAAFEMGQTFEAMGQPEEAQRVYEDLVEHAPHSRLRDDAAFRAAMLQRAEDGGASLREFVRAYPHSRHRAEAERLGATP